MYKKLTYTFLFTILLDCFFFLLLARIEHILAFSSCSAFLALTTQFQLLQVFSAESRRVHCVEKAGIYYFSKAFVKKFLYFEFLSFTV